LHKAFGTDGDHGVLHAVEQGFELALAGAHGGKAALDLLGSLVDGCGDASNFVQWGLVDAGAEVALFDAGSDVHNALQATGGPDGPGGGDQQRDEKCES
jgi:hypothetical protein